MYTRVRLVSATSTILGAGHGLVIGIQVVKAGALITTYEGESTAEASPEGYHGVSGEDNDQTRSQGITGAAHEGLVGHGV